MRAKRNAYAVFRGMLDKGNPPDDWVALLKKTTLPAAQERLARIGSDPAET